MKKALAILLTICIIAQGMVNMVLCVYYEINKKEIAAKLCINKNKPGMHCDGQCYLGRQLKKAEENEKRQSQSLLEKTGNLTLYHQAFELSFIPNISLVSYPHRYADHWLMSAMRKVPEQPPKV